MFGRPSAVALRKSRRRPVSWTLASALLYYHTFFRHASWDTKCRECRSLRPVCPKINRPSHRDEGYNRIRSTPPDYPTPIAEMESGGLDPRVCTGRTAHRPSPRKGADGFGPTRPRPLDTRLTGLFTRRPCLPTDRGTQRPEVVCQWEGRSAPRPFLGRTISGPGPSGVTGAGGDGGSVSQFLRRKGGVERKSTKGTVRGGDQEELMVSDGSPRVHTLILGRGTL